MAWEVGLVVLSGIYGTYPVHLRFLYVLLKKTNKDLDPSVQILLTNLTVYNILFASSYAFIQEPAYQGLFLQFYVNNAQWLGRIELIKATALVFCQGFHMLVGLNRRTAFAFPFRQKQIWTPRHTWIVCGIVWGVVVGMALPIIVFPSTQFIVKFNFFGIISLEYLFLSTFEVYPLMTMIYTGVFEVANVFIYIGILILMKRYKPMQIQQGTYDNFTKNIKRMAFAAAVNSTGELAALIAVANTRGWISFLLFLAYYVFLCITGTKMVDFAAYSLILRIIVSFNNMLTPWVMLATFQSMRSLFINRKPQSHGRISPLPLANISVTH